MSLRPDRPFALVIPDAAPAAIRDGAFDGRLAEVLDTLEPSIRDKVAVANPRYLGS